MPSIYNISDWTGSPNEFNQTIYQKNAIVKNNGYFYYATQYHIAAASFIEDYNLNLWNGVGTDENGTTKPKFFWVPSYGGNINKEPKLNVIQFGDGYIQRSKKQINNNLLNLNLNFNNRDINEFTAICHFLEAREGEESFLYTPQEPFNALKKFICLRWNSVCEFYDNNSISAEFIEVIK